MTTSKSSGSGFVHECFYRCDSRVHASNLTAVVTKSSLSDEKVAAYLKWCCVKYAQALDTNGRSLIHVAASKGRLKLLLFLLTHKEVNINCKDQESFYSALHRSLFYGQIHCAVRLIQSGANLQQNDLDDLTPLDHVMKDRPSVLTYSNSHPCEVYVWGTNTNYNLGIGHHHSRSNPEPLDLFRKENILIKQAFMSKFHSLFLGSDGKVWCCGLGSGGRLGLGDEVTTLIPKVLKIGNSSEPCKTASIGIDHSILLLENNSVWSFGLNNFHQLGHYPPPEKILSPKVIKSLKGVEIIGISASKFHSVFWTKTQLFTCGLHGGQLGHMKTNEVTISVPRLVTTLQLSSSTIKHVATSEGATVVVSDKGDVYLLHEYQCRKLTSKTCKLLTKKICVLGGHLDHKVSLSNLQDKGGEELKVLILTEKNTIYLWQKSTQQITRCLLSLRRYLDITDLVWNRASLLITTKDGEAFQGMIKIKPKKNVSEDEKLSSPKTHFTKFLEKGDCECIKLRRLPHIHRAVNISSDLKGRNFAVVQVHPKSCLLEIPLVETSDMKQNMKMLLATATEFDTLHDVIFEVQGVKFPAHRYIVSHSCEVLEEMINKAIVIDDVSFVKIENIQPQTFQRILSYLYTGECDLLPIGISPISFDQETDSSKKELSSLSQIDITNNDVSAFEYYKQQRFNKKKSISKVENSAKDPFKALRDATRMFELTSLAKKLETLNCDNGYLCKTNGQNIVLDPPTFNRKHLQSLWDVNLESENGIIIKAHKCILGARLEYFNCMFSQGWLESSMKKPLYLPIPGNVLDIFIRYLYTDEAPEISNSEDLDLASHILVIADQYFCTRLKEIAESSLANLINLKNAAEMLQFAATYNAIQLKQCAMEFICLNLSAILESRSLEVLENSLLEDLRDFYRSWLPCMNRRNISTNSDEPDDGFVESIYNSEPVSLEKVEEEPLSVKTIAKKPKRKSQREKKNSESERTLNASFSSLTSDEELPGPKNCLDIGAEEETWIKVTSSSSKQRLSKSKIRSSEMKMSPPINKSKSPSNPIRKPIIFNSQHSSESPMPTEMSKPINTIYSLSNIKKDSFLEQDKEFTVVKISSDKDFPALSASTPERTTSASPKSPNEGFKKFVKLSQKQRKKLSIKSVSENEESAMKFPSSRFTWRVPKLESQLLTDATKQESGTINQRSFIPTSSPWQNSSSSICSLSAIMAAERHQKDLITKMKSKPLEYTQMEDKAIDDLILLYDVPNVTDEKITVRRADYVLFSPPVWVSSHR